MIDFTDIARERVLRFLDAQRGQGVAALRVAGTKAEQKLWLVKAEDRRDDDTILDLGGFEVFVDPMSQKQLTGATVDFVDDMMQSGFRLFWPSPRWDDNPVAQRVQDVLDREINPGVASHGGVVTLEGVEGDAAIVRLGGGCQGCGAADITLKSGVEQAIMAAVPEIRRVLDVTDHASGTNPYYAPSETGNSPVAQD